MPAVEQWAIILGIAAAIAGLRWVYVRTSRPGPGPAPEPRPWPADSHVAAQQLPPQRLWVGFIGPDGWWGNKYWVCPHDHPSGPDAAACARNHLTNGMWDGR